MKNRIEELEALIGQPPKGSHPDEWRPRDKTWHRERLNWAQEVDRLRAQLDELAMLVRMLVRQTKSDNETARRAMGYLHRHNLQGSVLRDTLRDEADYGAGDCVPTDR